MLAEISSNTMNKMRDATEDHKSNIFMKTESSSNKGNIFSSKSSTGLTRSAGTLNLSLKFDRLEPVEQPLGSPCPADDSINNVMENWSPFKPGIKRTASKSGLSPFIKDDAEFFRKYMAGSKKEASKLRKTDDEYISDVSPTKLAAATKQRTKSASSGVSGTTRKLFKLNVSKSAGNSYNDAKPNPVAFMSTGLVSKSQRKNSDSNTPGTPMKPTMFNVTKSRVKKSDVISTLADIVHTPTKNLFNFSGPHTPGEGGADRSFNDSTTLYVEDDSMERSTSEEHLFSKFENITHIGSGDFSNVYGVTFQGNRYAVKKVKTKNAVLSKLKKEIEILQILQNGNNDAEGREYMLNYVSDWTFGQQVYIMTEFCENGTLDKFLQEQAHMTKLEDWRIWKIMVELSLGLRYIHGNNIIHLDLKPANIFITFEGSLKIGDFGMATTLPIPVGFENEGDREYIAPEIIRDGHYSAAADIFSLGLIIVEIAANVMLPENGFAWQKLRSGDLSDAGRLSSMDLCDASIFSNKMIPDSCSSVAVDGVKSIPAWVPKFLKDGESLERIVKEMINPDYTSRPTAEQILQFEECEYVEMTRKAGAVIQEDDFGPKPETEVW